MKKIKHMNVFVEKLYRAYFAPRRIIDLSRQLINRNFNYNDSIVIAGSPRSGTTWMMELLSYLPDHFTIFEPLHLNRFPEAKKFGFNMKTFLCCNIEDNNQKKYMEKVLSGNVVSKKPQFKIIGNLGGVKKRITSKKPIIKFVRANRILPWINENFSVKQIIYIIRHPCAVIASQKQRGVFGYVDEQSNEYIPTIDDIIKEAYEMKIDENIIYKLRNMNTDIEVLAAEWCLDNIVPIRYYINNRYKCNNWKIISYEHMVLNSEKVLLDILDKNENKSTIKLLLEKINEPSMTTKTKISKEIIKSRRKQLEKWRNIFNEDEINKILNVLKWFDINIYNNHTEPIYMEWKKLFNNTQV